MNATVAVTGDQIVQSNLEMKIKCVLLCHDPCSPLTDTPGGCVTVYKVGHSSIVILLCVLQLSCGTTCVLLFACMCTYVCPWVNWKCFKI